MDPDGTLAHNCHKNNELAQNPQRKDVYQPSSPFWKMKICMIPLHLFFGLYYECFFPLLYSGLCDAGE